MRATDIPPPVAASARATIHQPGMQRTTLLIPDGLRDRLRQIAAERGVSMATVVREALEERVARSRPVPRSLGVGASRSADTSLRTAAERPEPRACL